MENKGYIPMISNFFDRKITWKVTSDTHLLSFQLRIENLMGYFPHSTKFFLVYSRVMRRSTDTLGNNMLDLFHSWPL